MEYLVNTKGKVSTIHNKAYVVKAKSEQEAQEIANKRFCDEFESEEVYSETQTFVRTKRAIAAMLLMLIAVVISFLPFSLNKPVLGFIPREVGFDIKPDIPSCVYAIVFYATYVIRFKGIERTIGNWIDIVFTILCVLLLASICKLVLNAENLKFLGLIPVMNPQKVLIVAIVASLLGVKLVSVLCMFFVALLAVSNLSDASEAMDVWGVVYIMSAFVGLLLYVSVEPAMIESLPHMKKIFSKTAKAVKNDFSGARKEVKGVTNKFIK